MNEAISNTTMVQCHKCNTFVNFADQVFYRKTLDELEQAKTRIERLEIAGRNIIECLASQVPKHLDELEKILNESNIQSAIVDNS